jgi:hypothetical protein
MPRFEPSTFEYESPVGKIQSLVVYPYVSFQTNKETKKKQILWFKNGRLTVAEQSKACTVFVRSEAWIVGSNPTQDMDVWCMRLFCVCVVLCLGRGLATSWSPVQGVLPSVKWWWNWEIRPTLQSGSERKRKTVVRWKSTDVSEKNISPSSSGSMNKPSRKPVWNSKQSS